MFATSQDILNWVSIICVLAVTFLVVWVTYYLINITHKAYSIIHEIEKVVNKAEEIITIVHEKVKNKVYAGLITEMIKQATKFVKKDKNKEKKK